MKSFIHVLCVALLVAVFASTSHGATAIARVDLLDSNGHATGIGILVPLETGATKGKLLTEVRDIVSSKTADSAGRVLDVKTQRFEAGWAWETAFKNGKWSVSVSRTVVEGTSKIDGDELPISRTANYLVDGIGLGERRSAGGAKDNLRISVESID